MNRAGLMLALILGAVTSITPVYASSFGVGETYSGGTISVTSVQECSQSSSPHSAAEIDRIDDEIRAYAAAEMSCRARTRITDAFETASVSLSVAGAITACTAIGAPVAVWLSLGGAVTGLVQMVVKRLPCSADADDLEAHQMSVTTLCEMLIQKGIECVE